MKWQPIGTAPKDGSLFIGWDSKHGRVRMRLYYDGATLRQETWAIDPSGLLEPPEPHLWQPDTGNLPDRP